MTGPRWRWSLAVVALGALAAPALAAADVRFEFRGRGYGHGVGLAQYGARGAALAGWDHRRILAHYYRGTRLERRVGRPVRALLYEGREPAAVGTPVAGVARGADGQRVGLAAGAVAEARVVDGRVQVTLPGQQPVSLAAPASVNSPDGVVWAGRAYRGGLILRIDGSSLRIVNVVGMERYLAGVVPGEMPSSWGDDAPAALRAQAVAARSYTEATRHPEQDFDVYSDVRSQVYIGRSGEDPRSTAAVRATAGQVVTYAGAVITAFYHSSSGGRTADIGEGFSLPPQPYLVGVGDPFDRVSPVRRWTAPALTGTQLGRRLRLGAPVRAIAVTRHRPGGRVARVMLVLANGRRRALTGPELRIALKLRSTWLFITRRPA